MIKHLLLYSLLMFGCSDHHQKYTGHWHKVIDDNGLYHAITITDTSIIIDPQTFGGEFTFDFFGNSDTISIAGITMYKNKKHEIIGFEEPDKWSYIEKSPKDFVADFSCNLFVECEPEAMVEENPFLMDSMDGIPLFIGKLKPNFSSLSNKPDLITQNNYYIQFQDVLITKQDLFEIFYEANSVNGNIILYVDKNCPSLFISDFVSIKNQIFKTIELYAVKIDLINQKIKLSKL